MVVIGTFWMLTETLTGDTFKTYIFKTNNNNAYLKLNRMIIINNKLANKICEQPKNK